MRNLSQKEIQKEVETAYRLDMPETAAAWEARQKNPADELADNLAMDYDLSRKAAAQLLGKLGGASKSAKKQAASRKNGKKGGRPRLQRHPQQERSGQT